MKYVLVGAKTYGTLARIFRSGVEYSEGDLGSLVDATTPTGAPYFQAILETKQSVEAAPESSQAITDTLEGMVADESPPPPPPEPVPEAPVPSKTRKVQIGRRSRG